VKKTKVGTVTPNSNQNLSNCRYSKKEEIFFQKYYCLQGVPEEENFKKYDFYDKK